MIYDVIIAGAGPAGASTALHLAQRAPDLLRRTLVLEQARHPRPKLCAGAVMLAGERILRRLDLDLTTVPHADVHAADFSFQDRGFTYRRGKVLFRAVQRPVFDAWLVEAVRSRGITVQEETRVLSVHRAVAASGRPVVTLETNRGVYRACAVVGADGATGVVRRAVAPLTERPRRVASALEMVVPRAPERPGRARFDFTVAADGVQGYVWHFPTLVDGRLAHTRGIYDSRVHPAQRPNLRTALRRALEREGEPQAAARPVGHPVRWFDPWGPFSAPGMLLVGDAAGVDPLLGEGISFALAYGEVAALELRDAFAQQDFTFTGYRQRLLAHPLGRCLRRRLFIARLRYRSYPYWFQRHLYDPLGTLIHRLFARSILDWI